jgi:hypothetical protein
MRCIINKERERERQREIISEKEQVLKKKRGDS